MKTQKSPRVAVAFTLVELLVVISMLMILLCLLLPSLGRAREMAEASSCATVVRSIGMTNLQYANENNNIVMPAYSVGGTSEKPETLTWDQIMMNFKGSHTEGDCVGGDPKLVQCPGGPWHYKPGFDDEADSADNLNRKAAHYALNTNFKTIQTGSPAKVQWQGGSWANDPKNYGGTPVRTSNWGDATGTIFLSESFRVDGWSNWEYAGQVAPIYAQAGLTWSMEYEPYWQRKHARQGNVSAGGRTIVMGKATTLFCDGRVALYLPEDTVGHPGMSLADRANLNATNVAGMWTSTAGD